MITLKCKKHPRYMAKQAPRCDCHACWWLYSVVHGLHSHNRKESKVEVVR